MALSICNTKTDSTGRELLEHGSVQFPIACYHDDLAWEDVPWHWHDELEAAVVTEGAAVIAIDGERYTAKKGDGFFINKGVLHAAWDIDTSECRLHSLVFHSRLVGGSLDSVFWSKYLQPLTENTSLKGFMLEQEVKWKQEAVQAIEKAWKSCAKETPGYEFEVRSALSQLIYLIVSHEKTRADRVTVKEVRNGSRIKLMLQYVQEHYAEEISIKQIAESALISESECLRCFRNTIGTTPIRYLKLYRIQKAAELLKNTKEKIVDIGIQCGFQDMSYFAKAFRNIYGCTPSEFRK